MVSSSGLRFKKKLSNISDFIAAMTFWNMETAKYGTLCKLTRSNFNPRWHPQEIDISTCPIVLVG